MPPLASAEFPRSAVTPLVHDDGVNNDLVDDPTCTCERDRERTIERRFAIAPAAGGGTVAWATAFARLLIRLLALPTHCVVITQDPNQRYVQLMLGDGHARVEASSNHYLDGDFRLGATEERHLRALGFASPDELGDTWRPRNWWFEPEHTDPVHVADVLAHTMIAVMCFDERLPITVVVFGDEHPCEACAWGTD
jgi:hypothetical protein